MVCVLTLHPPPITWGVDFNQEKGKYMLHLQPSTTPHQYMLTDVHTRITNLEKHHSVIIDRVNEERRVSPPNGDYRNIVSLLFHSTIYGGKLRLNSNNYQECFSAFFSLCGQEYADLHSSYGENIYEIWKVIANMNISYPRCHIYWDGPKGFWFDNDIPCISVKDYALDLKEAYRLSIYYLSQNMNSTLNSRDHEHTSYALNNDLFHNDMPVA